MNEIFHVNEPINDLHQFNEEFLRYLWICLYGKCSHQSLNVPDIIEELYQHPDKPTLSHLMLQKMDDDQLLVTGAAHEVVDGHEQAIWSKYIADTFLKKWRDTEQKIQRYLVYRLAQKKNPIYYEQVLEKYVWYRWWKCVDRQLKRLMSELNTLHDIHDVRWFSLKITEGETIKYNKYKEFLDDCIFIEYPEDFWGWMRMNNYPIPDKSYISENYRLASLQEMEDLDEILMDAHQREVEELHDIALDVFPKFKARELVPRSSADMMKLFSTTEMTEITGNVNILVSAKEYTFKVFYEQLQKVIHKRVCQIQYSYGKELLDKLAERLWNQDMILIPKSLSEYQRWDDVTDCAVSRWISNTINYFVGNSNKFHVFNKHRYVVEKVNNWDEFENVALVDRQPARRWKMVDKLALNYMEIQGVRFALVIHDKYSETEYIRNGLRSLTEHDKINEVFKWLGIGESEKKLIIEWCMKKGISPYNMYIKNGNVHQIETIE